MRMELSCVVSENRYSSGQNELKMFIPSSFALNDQLFHACYSCAKRAITRDRAQAALIIPTVQILIQIENKTSAKV